MRYEVFGLSDRGQVRKKNEDALLLNERLRVYAVADGLGGLPRGALASNLTVQYLEEALSRIDDRHGDVDFRGIIAEINQRVYAEGKKISEELGIGSTLTCCRILEDSLHFGHVGDSALVRFDDSGWKQITTDHTMEQEVRDRLKPGEEAYIPEDFSHMLTRCIGQRKGIEVDTSTWPIHAGDRYLLCSDGVTKISNYDEISEMLVEYTQPERFVRDLIALANERGGPDNTTAIALFFAP